MDKNCDFLMLSKRIFSLALPMAGTQLISVASGFFCMVMLAQLGSQVLAASALIFSTELSIVVIGISILFSLSVLIGHAYGAKNHLAIGNYLQQGWTLSIFICIPIMILFWNIKLILIFLGQSKEISGILQIYFHAFAWCVIPEFLSVCNQQFGYGVHKKMLIVSTSLMSMVVLIVTAYVLIFGKFGFPQLGVAGLGYARAVQNTFFFLFTTLFFYYDKSFARFELFQYRVHRHLNYFSQMIKIGWPITIQMGGEMMSFFVAGIMIGWLGSEALAAFQVVNQYCFIVIISIFSLSQASGILVGYARGAEQFHEIKKLGYVSLTWVLVGTLIVASVFILFPKSLASPFLNVYRPKNAKIVELISLLFLIMSFSLIFDGLRNMLIGILRGLFDTKFPMQIGLLVTWLIGVPFAYYLAFPLQMGVAGMALGSTFGMFIGASIMLLRWHKLSEKIFNRNS